MSLRRVVGDASEHYPIINTARPTVDGSLSVTILLVITKSSYNFFKDTLFIVAFSDLTFLGTLKFKRKFNNIPIYRKFYCAGISVTPINFFISI